MDDQYTDTEKENAKELEFIKEQALKAVKKEYEKFYIMYAATKPDIVNNIRPFLDWLKNSTVENVQAKRVECVKRNGKICIYAQFETASMRYTELQNEDVVITNDTVYASLCKNYYYSPEATSNIFPSNFHAIAKTQSRHLICAQNYLARCTYANEHLEKSHFDAPSIAVYYDCHMDFPYQDRYTLQQETASLHFYWTNYKLYLVDEKENPGKMLTKNQPKLSTKKNRSHKGCYIATAVYGSYDCPQVWTLRRYRDNILGPTWYGRVFIRFYYAISPTLVKWFGNREWFKKLWRSKLDKMVSKLNANGVSDTPYQDIDWQHNIIPKKGNR